MNTNIVIEQSGIAFGTSGARGLVADFTPDVCAAFSIAFIKSIDMEFGFDTVAIAIDNRPSSYAMAQACAEGLKQLDLNVVYYGVIPTPALAHQAMKDNIPSIMVTGSHIPFDRNGLKFYRPDGEISKTDEQAILGATIEFTGLNENLKDLNKSDAAKKAYIQRYSELFRHDVLAGKKIGIYEHSSAGRDIYKVLFESLGAEVKSLERSDIFVPIDTEAVSAEDRKKALDWSKKYNFDAIFSTDGDGDRPLLADENGNWLSGDTLGLLTSQLLNIEALAVPVSCNTAIEKSESFKYVTRTKIGSPYVIAEFSKLRESFTRVAGFEANGGYLLGSNIEVNGKLLTALPTRDALLPVLTLLAQPDSIATIQLKLPKRFTASDRIKNFSTNKSNKIIIEATEEPEKLLAAIGFKDFTIENVNTIDGLRITFLDGQIIHLRPSGNAPELRCYAEADTYLKATQLVSNSLEKVQHL
ncbi:MULTISPECIES: phosphomannomutase [unclassified Pseudoalteromonas]|uniref:phosphomannomutase n=1 Tax=unclassified Pseudoalteromonas TaxID=194690 RepID=UPI0004A05B0E|nr:MULTISPECIES: phosphomannomutase [unclassified Pseudoalteromonas]KDC54839.1 phosphomannomutase [Pseudoalteromonas sp. S3431]MDQ2045213.1 phosphomannomutase [Pseudoalteromonas sp. 20-92]